VSELEQRGPAASPELHFRDPDAATRNLSHIRQLVPEKVYESLSALLLTAANPDAAVNQFERLAEVASPIFCACWRNTRLWSTTRWWCSATVPAG